MVVEARPIVYNHNIETVPRLYRHVRPKAKYSRSLEMLSQIKIFDPNMATKSGIMVGLGETIEEIEQTMTDLRGRDVDFLTVGQYLQPDKGHLPVNRYWHPDEYEAIRQIGAHLGFKHVEAGPLVRSSYHAGEQIRNHRQVSLARPSS
jgi:lipoic acid synthetase